MYMMIAVCVFVLILFPFANDLYSFVAEPLLAQLPTGSTMIATQVISPFLTPFKLALVAAIFLAMPYLLYQLWEFVSPGLYKHEKRFRSTIISIQHRLVLSRRRLCLLFSFSDHFWFYGSNHT